MKNVSVFATPTTLDFNVGVSFNLSAPGAAKFVEPDAFSVSELSTLEFTNVSTV